MMHEGYAYGAWGIVVTMAVVSLFFIAKFLPMRTRMQKQSGGALMAANDLPRREENVVDRIKIELAYNLREDLEAPVPHRKSRSFPC